MPVARRPLHRLLPRQHHPYAASISHLMATINVKFGAKETIDAHEMQIEVALGETGPKEPAGPPGSVSSITKATNLGGVVTGLTAVASVSCPSEQAMTSSSLATRYTVSCPERH